jgi:hypothetical protein
MPIRWASVASPQRPGDRASDHRHGYHATEDGFSETKSVQRESPVNGARERESQYEHNEPRKEPSLPLARGLSIHAPSMRRPNAERTDCRLAMASGQHDGTI